MSNTTRFRRKAASVVSSLLMPLASPMFPQDAKVPAIRATTRLVELDVVVLDKRSRPITGLSQDDFQVFDNGQEQKIVHFSRSPGMQAFSPERSPLVITNRRNKDERPPGMIVILVDELILQAHSYGFTPIPEDAKQPIKSARLEVLKFLSTLKPGEQVALYALRQEGVVIIHDVTDDSEALMAAAKTLGTGLRMANLPVRNTEGTKALSTLRDWWESPWFHREKYQSSDFGDRVLLGYGFQAIAQHLQGVPGRKNLVLISSTLPSNITDFIPELMFNERDANIPRQPSLTDPTPTPQYSEPGIHYNQLRGFARWLSNANIAVYPIDANGLSTTRPSLGQWAAADLIASETGGRAVFDSNGLDQHLREVLEETAVTYDLGYYPGDAAWDGKYHKIELKLKREGLKVLCRKGYFALDEPIMQNPDAALRFAARSVAEGVGVGVTLNVSSNPLEWGPEQVVLKLDTHDIHFEQSDGRWKASIDLGFAELSRDGRILGGVEDHIDLALLPDSYNDAKMQGWFYPRELFVSRAAVKLRVVVRDLSTGALGSVSVPVLQDKHM